MKFKKKVNQVIIMVSNMLLLVVAQLFISCSKEEVDIEPPVIHIDHNEAFPVSCAVIYAGHFFDLNMHVTDNVELGSFSISIHHSFNHHTHSTEDVFCPESPEKDPINPWVYIEVDDIPKGLKQFTIKKQINVPRNVDNGDYHLMIRVTDNKGWQTVKGIPIKIE